MPLASKVLRRYLSATTRVRYSEVKEYLEDKEDLKTFATAVKSVAKRPEVKKFHNDRAFIHSVKAEGFPRSDKTEWCTKLVAAHVCRFLELARADLVGAMDPADVEASRIDYGDGSTFNFILL